MTTNSLKTALLLGLMTGLILFIGQMVGGRQGMTLALLFAGVMNFVGYFYSDKIALAAYRAKPVTRDQSPEFYRITENLCQRGGLPMPRLYVIPSESPNAFATGRNPQHAAVAVTEGTLQLLSRPELEGVIAHELAHVKNRDILISSVAATLAGAIMWVANMARFSMMFGGSRDDDRGGGAGVLLAAVVAPIAALLIQMAISRSREFQADATGAAMAGNPHGLASALQKLESYSKRIPLGASAQTAHMFIVNPFTGGGLLGLFGTHPPMQQRIARLLGRPVA